MKNYYLLLLNSKICNMTRIIYSEDIKKIIEIIEERFKKVYAWEIDCNKPYEVCFFIDVSFGRKMFLKFNLAETARLAELMYKEYPDRKNFFREELELYIDCLKDKIKKKEKKT